MSYEAGHGGVWGCCDRCMGQYRHRHLRREWTSLIVCPECWDPKPAELTPPRIYPEGLPIRDARPPQGLATPQPYVFIDPVNPITPADL